jgi:Na+/melibiose symporter-like transporter
MPGRSPSTDAPSDAAAGARGLTLPQLLAFGFPALPHAFIALPLNIVIPAFYATHTAVTLLQIGVFTSASRLLDAVLDPLVGFLSDRFETPWGRRKPWGLAAGLVCAVSLFFLFQPPASADIVYYGVWSFSLYFGFSLFEIPRSAWSAEISRDYTERSRINSSVAQFNVIGSLVFWLTPILLWKITGATQITGTSLSAIAWLYVLLMPAGLALAAWITPKGAPVVTRALRFVDILKSIIGNRPLGLYLLAYGLWGVGQGASLSTTLLFLDDRMKLAAFFPFLMIALFATTVLVIPLWMRLAARLGRHRVWAISLIASAVTRPLVLLVAPGPTAMWPMLALTCLSAVFMAPWNFAPPSMLSDVIDYDLWKSRTNKAGNLFALNTLLVKASMAIGAGGAFVLLDAFHYQAGKTNSGLPEVGMLLCYMAIPAIFHVAAGVIGWNFPLDEKRQAIVRKRLESHAATARAATAAAAPAPSAIIAASGALRRTT